MLISNLLKNINYTCIQGSIEQEISSIVYHSDHVIKDSAFVAIKGFSDDGHHYIKQAIENGASVIFIEDELSLDFESDITLIRVENTRVLLSHLAKVFYNHPSKNLHITGITGTNGKTSIAKFLHSIYLENKESIALLGTNGLYINEIPYSFSTTTVTTPEAIDLQQLFKDFLEKGIENVVMEVSSHSVELNRVTDINFDTGIFINLTPDHLELHKTLENYFQAKAGLFNLTSKNNIINTDDPYGKRLVKMLEAKKVKTTSVGIHGMADIYARDIKYTLQATTYTAVTPSFELDIKVNFPGEIYVYNSLLALASAYVNNIPQDIIKKGIEKLNHIDGRFNIIYENNNYKIIIDFAHTEDSLKNLLKTVKPFVKGNLILVFGVYADMSKEGEEKRFNMGRIAGEYADFSIVTLDNPKYFDQNIIMKQIEQGISSSDGPFKSILDREKAIEYAIKQSDKDDIILIAGKGHERSQIINGEEIYINEEEIALHSLKEKTF